MTINLIFLPTTIIYFLVVILLFAYGINFFYLSFVALRTEHSSGAYTAMLGDWPHVTIQAPLFNERYVAERLIQALSELDYPVDKLEIQILDDSTDETVDIVAAKVKALRARGHDIKHLHRQYREGYKAGALRDGMQQASGEFIAIFDADFIPVPDFLKRTIPHFETEKLAFVQARWDHTNRHDSVLTYLQAISIDAHFMVEQLSRSRYDYWFNFNGTAGIWRKSAIEDAGGWQAATLTEDLDLSYRTFLKGWQALYLPDLAVPSELPTTFTAFRRQQHRWARGSFENAIRLLPDIWRSQFPLRLKVEGTLHLTGYGVHLMLFMLSLLYPIVILVSVQIPSLITLFGVGAFFSITALAPTMLFITGQHGLKRSWWKMIPAVLFVSAFGSGMMVNTLRAFLEMLNNTTAQFKRTPKYGGQSWQKSQYRLKLDSIVWWEILLGTVNLASCVLAVYYQQWFIAFYAALFGIGLFFNAGYTLAQSVYERRLS